MKRKLGCVLLVDDDEPTNFIHAMVIRKSGLAEFVITARNGGAALEYLATQGSGTHPFPDLILLDINMPVMDGWEFLREYRRLYKRFGGRTTIVMLTTSIHPRDAERARNSREIDDYLHKPLSRELIGEILRKHFV